jgi:hypothetical protein
MCCHYKWVPSKAIVNHPNYTIHGWYKPPEKIGWFILALPTLNAILEIQREIVFPGIPHHHSKRIKGKI